MIGSFLCAVGFYELLNFGYRLFMQPTTDDASHDEALSSRVAALNLLDLGLGHLGIEIGEAVNEKDLDVVVRACGDSEYLSTCCFYPLSNFFYLIVLAGLDSCQSPGEKAAILVAAHKIVVGKFCPSAEPQANSDNVLFDTHRWII